MFQQKFNLILLFITIITIITIIINAIILWKLTNNLTYFFSH